MIEIRFLRPDEAPQAKLLILDIAHRIFQWPMSFDEVVRTFTERGTFHDLENVQAYYFDRRGLFLAVVDNGRLVGTGALAQLTPEIAELKRMWLLEPYQGQGVGYRLWQQLSAFARTSGYRTIRLTTDRRQDRAQRFYHRLGFVETGRAGADDEDIFMELHLEPENRA